MSEAQCEEIIEECMGTSITVKEREYYVGDKNIDSQSDELKTLVFTTKSAVQCNDCWIIVIGQANVNTYVKKNHRANARWWHTWNMHQIVSSMCKSTMAVSW